MTNLSDLEARARALALEQSFIVRAPAGSGKTDLLTRRFLKLLTAVDEPEEILAITFTRAATAEMRSRILKHLEEAATGTEDTDERTALARAALRHSEARGWQLLTQPHRLNIETIDSLCLRLAHNQPLLSRMGGRLAPTENAAPLYAQAARQTLGRLGTASPELNAALTHLLEMRDNNLPDCQRLISEMLSQRDQWIRAFPLTGNFTEADWNRVRARLEQPFCEEATQVHAKAHHLLHAQPGLAEELIELAHYACANDNQKIQPLAATHALPKPEAVEVELWRCLAHFLLTENEWRKPTGLNKTTGFPTTGKEQKLRMGNLLTQLQTIPNLRESLCAARDLPSPRYDENQWTALRHIFTTLRHAVAELRVLFAEQNTVDFTELSLAAREVLGNPEADADVLLAVSGNIRHLLVDEFQDTSRSQHELLRLLIRAWEAPDNRTCFFVGDPMQSIYLFRQAEVELFEQVAKSGLVSEEHSVIFEPLELTTNFRSHAGLTTRWNEIFTEVFQANAGQSTTHIAYSNTYAAEPALPEESVHIHPQIIGEPSRKPTPEEKELALEGEAEQVLAILDQHQSRIQQAQAEGLEYRVAVLVRSRPHLAKIVSKLRERNISFRAVELEKLNERQELIDLLSLIRALLHPMDRVAWLSVLRAPWCGLTLDDLHKLTGSDNPSSRRLPMLGLIEQNQHQLSQEGIERLQRTTGILKQAINMRFQSSFAQWIERTWRTLGGPDCIDAAGYENTQVFFTMLDQVTPDGMACLTEDFENQLHRLFAQPDPSVSERAGIQLMTIHKAKGLGFDVVIVPGLDRRAAQDAQSLIVSLERTNPATGETEMLVAPIGYRGGEKHPTYTWVQKQRSQRADEELKRLFYVACTRARKSVHLLGTAISKQSGLKPGDYKSLLATAWRALQPDFEAANKPEQDNIIPFPGKEEALVFELAAAEEKPEELKLHRLPINAFSIINSKNVINKVTEKEIPSRPQGTREARQKGSIVHALFDRISKGAPLPEIQTIAQTLLRNAGFTGKSLEEAAQEIQRAVKNATTHPEGRWILAQHPQAQSETSWTTLNNGALETLRADRIFLAGPEPQAEGEDHLWIIDYKMTHPAGNPDFLKEQRETYAPQLTSYATMLREANNYQGLIRVGLYYPRIPTLDWWSEEE